jgi:hypothetical protein
MAYIHSANILSNFKILISLYFSEPNGKNVALTSLLFMGMGMPF